MSQNGICAIKPEFLINNHVREIVLECISQEDKLKLNVDEQQNDDVFHESDNEPLPKVSRLSKAEKKKLRGQNKARNTPFKVERARELCSSIIDILENEVEKCTNDKCQFLHDRTEYLRTKPKDIGNSCYNFKISGRCRRGVACRFGSEHITANGFNKINTEQFAKFMSKKPSTRNYLNYELLRSLRKRTYDFSLSQRIISLDDTKRKNKGKEITENTGNMCEVKNDNLSNSVTSGVVTDEDIIMLRKQEKKTIDWKDKLYLSPLTTVGNLPFRRISKEFGADITCGEMAMCSSLLQGLNQEWALVKRHETEDLFGVQLCGNNPHIFARAAQMIQENIEVDFVDINLGCPIDLVYKEGAGSGLLRRSHILGCVVRCTSEILNIPLTLKTRTGVYSNQNIAHTFIPMFKEWGASMITLHGRSREQRYTKLADWPYIEECAKLASPVPLFGNGDILSFEDYCFAKENYKSVSGVMIGRGALIKPWIFTEIKEQRLWDISSSERFDIIKKYVNYGLEHWGSDNKGVENTRRFLLEWLSFLYRYVPVGILEHPPQKINERPPSYRGRDELETLMASSSCTDWIKISEMLLGPVPENFNFLPKHKANSYK